MPKITNDTAYPATSSAALTDELVCLQSDVVKKMPVSQAVALAVAAADHVTYNAADTTITLGLADLNEVLVVENALAVAVNLPSVGAGDVGCWIQIHKRGAGSLTINAADSDTIEDSAGGGKVANTTAAQTYANIRLQLITATEWAIVGMPTGTWTTT